LAFFFFEAVGQIADCIIGGCALYALSLQYSNYSDDCMMLFSSLIQSRLVRIYSRVAQFVVKFFWVLL